MSRGKVVFVASQACLMVVFLVLASCSNGNLFGKLNGNGDSGNTKALMSDAENSLRNGDYSKALDLYERVLAKDSNNSQALYGASAASIQSAGINLGSLISNIATQSSLSNVSDLGTLISQSRQTIKSATVSSGSLLAGVDLDALSAVIDTAICRLNRIALGVSDGVIKSDSPDVLLNLGVLYILRAVLRPLNAGLLDITNTNGTYAVTVIDIPDLGTACASGVSNFSVADAQLLINDAASSYALFKRVAENLHLTGTPIIVKLENDLGDAVNRLMTSTDIPSQCKTLFSTEVPDINTYNKVFTTLPAGC